MAKITSQKTNMVTFKYHQEKSDQDYGSCLWADFHFDLDEYHLFIASDCGDYSYGWTPTPATEPFLHLMARIDAEYLLGKISSRSKIDEEQTFKNLKELAADLLDGEEADFDMEELESVCHCYSDVSGLCSAVYEVWEDSQISEYLECEDVYGSIETRYPYDAVKIVEVFKNHVQPVIRELNKREATP